MQQFRVQINVQKMVEIFEDIFVEAPDGLSPADVKSALGEEIYLDDEPISDDWDDLGDFQTYVHDVTSHEGPPPVECSKYKLTEDGDLVPFEDQPNRSPNSVSLCDFS